MSTREQSKAKRRDAILDAAIALLGVRDSHEVTTEEIADVAGVAPATVYNLVGTRDDLVHAIVARVLDDLAESLTAMAADEPPDPIAVAFLVGWVSLSWLIGIACLAYVILYFNKHRQDLRLILALDPANSSRQLRLVNLAASLSYSSATYIPHVNAINTFDEIAVFSVYPYIKIQLLRIHRDRKNSAVIRFPRQ